jgi:chorismate mutase
VIITKTKTKKLDTLRRRIDHVDQQLFHLLVERMKIARAIGNLKVRFGLPIFQRARLAALLESRASAARKLKLSPTFARKFFKLIHDESLGEQRELARKKRNK